MKLDIKGELGAPILRMSLFEYLLGFQKIAFSITSFFIYLNFKFDLSQAFQNFFGVIELKKSVKSIFKK